MNLERYIGNENEFPLEHRVLNIVLVFSFLFAVLATVSNYLLDLGIIITLIPESVGILILILYYSSLNKKKYLIPVSCYIFMLMLIVLPASWIYNGGLLGCTPFYVLIFSTVITVLLRGFSRTTTIGCLIMITSALIIIEYKNPSLIVGYKSEFDRYADISFGLLLTLISNTGLFTVITTHSVNEHKRANLYLAEIEKQKIDSLNEQFIRVFNISPTLMAICREKDLVYVTANDAWFDCLGFERTEVIGHSEKELNTLVVAENRINIDELALGKPEEYQVRTKQGEIRDWLVSKAQLQFDGEECILLASIDRTLSKHLEKEISRLDRLNLVGEIAASIGHEIRNPLTTVRGFLQLFQRRNKYLLDKENIDLMIAELDRANSIITEFLSLAKDRKISLKFHCLNKIIAELYQLIYATSVSEGIEIFLEQKSIPDVFVDDNEIRQLILNLTQNAREAMIEGGKIIISTCLINENVVLAIKDTGKGIPPEILEKLGTPFLTTKENGTGLGLAVCYRIAERNNAKIEVETDATGTTFSVKFNIMMVNSLST